MAIANVNNKRIAVIGAGPAGVTAAYRLTELGYPVDVFESVAYIGGLARSITLWGRQVDLGSHIYSVGRPEIDRIWNEVLSDRQYLVELRRGLLDRGRIHDYPFDPYKLVMTLGLMEAIRCVLSWAVRDRHRIISSAEDLIACRYGQRVYDRLLRSYTEKLWGVPSQEVDALFATALIGGTSASPAARTRRGRRFPSLRRPSRPRFPYPIGGTGALWEGMAHRVRQRGGVIHLLAPVDRIFVHQGRVRGLSVQGQSVDADCVISTLPIGRLLGALPGIWNAEPEGGPRARSTILVYLNLENGDPFFGAWLYILDKRVAAGRVTNVSAWQPNARAGDPASILCVEYWCSKGDKFWQTSDNDLRVCAEREMREVGIMKRGTVRRSHVERITGTHPGHQRGSAVSIEKMRAAVARIEGLWSVGRHGSPSLTTMSGAMAEGYAAADAVDKFLRQ